MKNYITWEMILLLAFCALLSRCTNNDDGDSFDWQQNGVRIEKGKVIAFFPKDSLAESRMNEIVDSLNLGIDASIEFIGGPYEWQSFANKPVTYYFEPGNFVSVTDIHGDIYIPLFRIKNYKAPWMHETMHALLRNKKGNWNERSSVNNYFTMPIWFTEGMAEYLAVKIEAVDSIRKFDLMKFGGYKKVDSSCYQAIKINPSLTSHIGDAGIPTKLLTDRKEYAPPFYTCSCSFVKFLAENYGLDKMLAADAEFEKEEETIELLTEKKLTTLKEEWISYLESGEEVASYKK